MGAKDDSKDQQVPVAIDEKPIEQEQTATEQEVPIAIEAKLIEQEHRTFQVLLNFRRAWKMEPGDARREAAWRALLWQVVTPNAVVAGVGVTAIIGLVFACRANALVGEQNVLLADQLRQQREANALVGDQIRQQREAIELDRHYRARERMDELVSTLYGRSQCEAKSKTWCSADDRGGVGECGPSASIAARRRAAREILWLTWSEQQAKAPIADRRQLAHALIPWFEASPEDHLEGVSLMGADLRCAEFFELSIKGMDLRWANLRFARIRGHEIDGVDWTKATCPDGTMADTNTGCKNKLGSKADWDKWQDEDCRLMVQTTEPPFPCLKATR
jgi:hypothetical protein